MQRRETYMADPVNDTSSFSREQIVEAYLKAFQVIDNRVTPLLGKATTRVLVQGAAKRQSSSYPFLTILTKMPYTEIVLPVLKEQLSGVPVPELTAGLDALLTECFTGLTDLTGNLIVPPLHKEVSRQLEQRQ